MALGPGHADSRRGFVDLTGSPICTSISMLPHDSGPGHSSASKSLKVGRPANDTLKP